MDIKKIICGIVAVTTLTSLSSCTKRDTDDYLAELSSYETSVVNLSDVIPNTVPSNLNYDKISESEFRKLSINEQQNYIVNTYNINYFDLVDAVTLSLFSYDLNEDHVKRSNITREAVKITLREDFEEIKNLFMILTEVKENFALERRNLNSDNLDVILGTIIVYSKYNYDEGYVNMNLLDNRTKSKRWVTFVSNEFFPEAGYSLYYQLISHHQFGAYESGIYKKYMKNKYVYPSYFGALDKLVFETSVHDYLNFCQSCYKTGVTLVEGGNNYTDEITANDRIENPTLKSVENDDVARIRK